VAQTDWSYVAELLRFGMSPTRIAAFFGT
jgi:hypothetical protein